MTPQTARSVLVYTRIAQNRWKTWLLVAFAIASIVPFVLAISYAGSTIIVGEMFGRAHLERLREIEMHKQMADLSLQVEGSYTDEIRMREINLRREDEREVALDRQIHLKLIGLIAAALLAMLALLFWGIASSPTSKILALTGARPADTPEAECKRLLENLSIGAGIPTPRLYVIETSSPNAFAAGTDPRHSVVVVTRGLLQLMDQRELEGVLAHELSHIVNRDTRLNTIVASIALFMRLPYLLRKRKRRNYSPGDNWNPIYRRFRVYRLAMAPLYLYIFFIAPLMASLIRAAISRGREYLADADAALLTRFPEGLMRALAKVRGAGSAIAAANPVVAHFYFSDPSASGFSSAFFGWNLLATHPPIDQRIIRLAEYHGGVPPAVVEEAVKAGQQFTKDHPAIAENDFAPVSSGDELAVLSVGNPLGRVCRVVNLTKPAALYDRPDLRSPVLRRIQNGELLVVFDDPGKFRQVMTSDQTFGYMALSVKLQKTDLFPNEVFGIKPAAPATPESEPSHEIPKTVLAAAPAAAPAPQVPDPIVVAGLTRKQLSIAAMVFVGVFAAMVLAMMQFGGR